MTELNRKSTQICKLTATRFQHQCKNIHGGLGERIQYYCTLQSFMKHGTVLFVVWTLTLWEIRY